MLDNANAIIILCSHLCKGEGVVPLEPREWTAVAQKLLEAKKEPKDIFSFEEDDYKNILGLDGEQTDRYKRLIDRSASMAFEIEKLKSKGIYIITRADKNFPVQIKRKLGKQSPPLFYGCGDIGIANDACIGFVGSRNIDESDGNFTRKVVSTCLGEGYSIVSGGARGVDSVAAEVVLENGGVAIEFLADNMNNKIKDNKVLRRIKDERLLLLSAVVPDAGFSVGTAMQRNKFIYAQSIGTVVVKSEYNKGGTWAGAEENLKHGWAHTLCWQNDSYKGNRELIAKGAIPIGEDFNPKNLTELPKKEEVRQSTIFDFFDSQNDD